MLAYRTKPWKLWSAVVEKACQNSKNLLRPCHHNASLTKSAVVGVGQM